MEEYTNQEDTVIQEETAPREEHAPRRRRTENASRYQELERYMTYILAGDAGLFVLYLLCAGFGVVWLKIILAIIGIAGSLLGIGYLYMTGELLKPRSLWMGTGFAAVVLCLLFSLILNYPSPNPYRKTKDQLPPISPSDVPSAPSDSGNAAAGYIVMDSFRI